MMSAEKKTKTPATKRGGTPQIDYKRKAEQKIAETAKILEDAIPAKDQEMTRLLKILDKLGEYTKKQIMDTIEKEDIYLPHPKLFKYDLGKSKSKMKVDDWRFFLVNKLLERADLYRKDAQRYQTALDNLYDKAAAEALPKFLEALDRMERFYEATDTIVSLQVPTRKHPASGKTYAIYDFPSPEGSHMEYDLATANEIATNLRAHIGKVAFSYLTNREPDPIFIERVKLTESAPGRFKITVQHLRYYPEYYDLPEGAFKIDRETTTIGNWRVAFLPEDLP
jgi:hypothetical protein